MEAGVADGVAVTAEHGEGFRQRGLSRLDISLPEQGRRRRGRRRYRRVGVGARARARGSAAVKGVLCKYWMVFLH